MKDSHGVVHIDFANDASPLPPAVKCSGSRTTQFGPWNRSVTLQPRS